MTDNELLNELEKRAEAYHDKIKKDFAIEELEKIKDEILNLGFSGWADKPKLDREEVLTILDKHISELKGRTNDRI